MQQPATDELRADPTPDLAPPLPPGRDHGDAGPAAPELGDERALAGSEAAEGIPAIGPNEHVFVTGASRSGKTVLLKELVRPIAGRIVIDTKHVVGDFANTSWGVIVNTPEQLAQAWEQGFFQLVWQPPLYEVRHPARDLSDSFSRGLKWIIEELGDPHGEPSVTIVVDEMRWVLPTKPHPYGEVLVCQGMGRGIGLMGGSQNAFHVFPNMLSDAFHVFAFRLQTRNDRAKLENDVAGCEQLAGLSGHQFMYHYQGDPDWRGPFELEL